MEKVGSIGDFVAVQNYTRHRYDENGLVTETEGVEEPGYPFTMVPESLAATVRQAHEVTKKPIWITEHGTDLTTDRDDERSEYIRQSLSHLHYAIADGVPVKGYVHWSLTDNWEWQRAYGAHFGLAEVDLETQKRTPRPSFTVYGDIARSNRL